MKTEYSVIIIGAGPAGLMAARTLHSNGIDFLIIDSKKEIGKPLKCGEGIQEKGFIELFGNSPHTFIKNKTHSFIAISDSIQRTIRTTYLLLDRPRFEKWLAAPVKSNLLLNTTCNDILSSTDSARVVSDKATFSCKLVILAYGCNYQIQKRLGLLTHPPILVPCIGGIFKNHNLVPSQLYFHIDDPLDSILWIFPKDRKTANVGLGLYPFSANKNITKTFAEFLKKHKIGLSGKPTFAGVFPTSGPIKRTFSDRLLVVGNAAGQVYGGSGEGIYFSLKAGQLAAQVASDSISKNNQSAAFLSRYEQMWKKEIGSHLEAGLVFSKLLFLGFKYKKLDKIITLASEKELVDLFCNGKTPLRASLALFFAERFGLFDEKRTSVPRAFSLVRRVLAALRLL